MRRRYKRTVDNLFSKYLEVRKQKQKATVLAVVFQGSSMSGFAFNEKKTSAGVQDVISKNNITQRYEDGGGFLNCTRHAEFNSLKKGDGDVVVVARQTAHGKYKCAKPCLVCEAAMRQRGVKTVFFSTDQGSFQKLRL